MSLMKFDLAKYLGKFSIGGVAMFLYDGLLDGKGFNMSSFYDALTFGGSHVLSSMANDLILNLTHLQDYSIIPMISEPVFNAFIYQYLYSNLLYDYLREGGSGAVRSDKKNMLLGAGLNVATKFIENPLMSLWGIKSY